GKWYLNVMITGADAFEGIMGAAARKSWLPSLPDASSLGPAPASPSGRYSDLNQRFADAWRVTTSSSLFDYPPGKSTHDFTRRNWPRASPPGDVPGRNPATPLDLAEAQKACKGLFDPNRHENCVFDVAVTGEPEFARTYRLTERLQRWATATTL